MSELHIPDHDMKVDYLPDWAKGYGDAIYETRRPNMVCSCGEKRPLLDNANGVAGRLAMLEHAVTKLAER